MARASDILEIILSAKDQTRQAFSSVTRNINNLSQTIEQNRRGLLRGGSRGGGGDADGGSLMGAIFGNVGGSLVKAGFILGAVKQIAGQVADITKAILAPAARFEQLSTSFEVMLGNASEARSLLQDLEQFTATTPFRMEEVAGGARILKVMGAETKDLVSEMRMLGDIAANIPATIEEMAFLFGQSRIEGKLLTRDLRQFATRGIPIFEELATVLGVSKAEIAELTEQGLIGFDALEEAFQNMTSEGGVFFGSTERQSQTLLGLWSTLADNFQLLVKEFSEGAILEGTKDIVKEGIGVLQWLKMSVQEAKELGAELTKIVKKLPSVRMFESAVDFVGGRDIFGLDEANKIRDAAAAREESLGKRLREEQRKQKAGLAKLTLEKRKQAEIDKKFNATLSDLNKKLADVTLQAADQVGPMEKLKVQLKGLDAEYTKLVGRLGKDLDMAGLSKATRIIEQIEDKFTEIAEARQAKIKSRDSEQSFINQILESGKSNIDRLRTEALELARIIRESPNQLKVQNATKAFDIIIGKLKEIKNASKRAALEFGAQAKSPLERAKMELEAIGRRAKEIQQDLIAKQGFVSDETLASIRAGQEALASSVLRDLLPESSGPAGLPTSQDARFLTGIAAQANEQARAQATRQKQLRATQKTNDLIKQLPPDIAEKISAFIPKALTPITG